MKNKFWISLIIGLVFTFITGANVIFAANVSADIANNVVFPKATHKQGIESPFSVQKVQSENISPATGELEIKQTDLFLKGKNGLDFALTRYFAQSESYVNGLYVDNSGYVQVENYSDTVTYKKYQIAFGWNWDLPYVETRGTHVYFNYGSAGTWEFVRTQDDSDSNLKYYPLKDMVFDYDYNHLYSNGIEPSYYYLKEKDGKTTYFSNSGRICCIVDRFGNQISFLWSYVNTILRITKITDSVGRDIIFSYDDTNNKITVSVSGGGEERKISYNKARFQDKITDPQLKSAINSNVYVLDSVVDAEGRQTNYEYTCNVGFMSLANKNIEHYKNPDQWPFVDQYKIYYASLKKITYPTGSQTMYGYGKFMKHVGIDGSMEFFKVTSRLDYKKDGTVANYREFNYKYDGTGEYDGYPYFIDYYYNDYCNISGSPMDLPDMYYIKTQVKDSLNNTELYTYNYKLLNIDTLKEGTDHKNEVINEYDLTKKTPLKTINRTYNKDSGQFMDKVENYEYDDYKNMTAYWDAQADRDVNNMPLPSTEHKISFTYDTTYHFTTGKTYKKDNATTIREEYTPTADNKSIQWAKVYENEVLKKQIKYTYDSFGNVTSDMNYLDNWTDYITTNYSYNDNDTTRNGKFNGLYVTRKWTGGVKDADGNLITGKTTGDTGVIDENYKYNWFGDLVEKQDGVGNISTFQYDKLSRLKKAINPDTTFKTVNYRSDTTENSVESIDEKGNKTKQIFDELGNLTYEQVYAKNKTTGIYEYTNISQYIYDDRLRLDTEKNLVNGSSTKYTYLSNDRILAKETCDKLNVLINKESYQYDDAFENGSLAKITKVIEGDLSSPAITTHTYMNKLMKVVAQEKVHDDNGIQKTYKDTFEYDYLGNKTKEKIARAYDEGWSQPWTTKYDYNYAGKVTNQYNINNDYTTTEYDALGRVKSVTDIKGNKAATRYSTMFTYDNLGRVLTESIPFENKNGTIYNTIKKHYYDRNDNIVREKVINNKSGDPQAISNPTFNQTDYAYNNRNMLVMVTAYNNGNPENYTQYFYDAVGNKVRMYTGLTSPLTIIGLDSVTPGSDNKYSVTKYEYNEINKLSKMTDPLLKDEIYTYDLNGNLKEKTDRNKNVISFDYDGLNRLLTKSVVTPTGEGNTSYSYAYTLTGNKKSMSGGAISVTYAYDDLGRLINEAESNGMVKEYKYDAGDNRKSFTIKQNGTTKINTTYDYDNLNRLWHVYENGQLAATYSFDLNGNRQSLEYANGNTTDYQYNLANKVTSMTNYKDTTRLNKLSDYTYTYYLDGNQESKADTVGNKTTSYVYDGLGRLKTETVSGAENTATSYAYDDANNRQTMTVAGASPFTTSYLYDANNRLQTETKTVNGADEITQYTYDDNGNQTYKTKEIVKPLDSQVGESIDMGVVGEDTSIDLTSSTYDGFNQLVSTSTGNTTASYTYNADGLRTSKTVNGVTTNHVWDGDQIVLEVDGSGNVIGKYIRGINLIAAEDNSGVGKYYLFNAHGDVVQLSDSTGNIIKNYDYDAFGVEKNPDANDTNVFRYCGEYFDKETGTIYLRARYYDPAIGRFISEDTNWGKDADPLSLNLYTYCWNNPILYVDPSGNGPVLSFMLHAGEWLSNKVVGIDTAAAGAKVLMFDKDKNIKGVYHANTKCWQRAFGYNDLYDWGFRQGSSMERAKFEFSVGDRKFIIWAWKGDYINLGAGAELGIYSNKSSILGLDVTSPSSDHWLVDTNLAMKMTLTLKDINGDTIIDYRPSEKQWWITGFNSNVKNVFAGSIDYDYAKTLTAISTVTFNTQDMYTSFFNKYGQGDFEDPRWSFDSKTLTATFKF